MAPKLERRVREPRVVDVMSDLSLPIDTKADFQNEENMMRIGGAIERPRNWSCQIEREEEHSAWMVAYKDPTNARDYLKTETLAMPEYRRLRNLLKQVSRFNKPPFTVVKEAQRVELPDLA